MATPNSYRVLIVEDEPLVADFIQQTLAGFGYDASAIATSAEEAMARASEKCPDLVLMDIHIKGKGDGISSAQLLQKRFGVPIVYLTGDADEATIERAKSTAPYGFLVKPVKAGEIRSTVEIAVHKHNIDRALQRSEGQLRAVIENIGDGVIVAGTDGQFTHYNLAAHRILGRGPSEGLLAEWSQELGIFHLDGVTPFPTDELPLALAIRGLPTDNVEMVVRASGQDHPVFLAVTGRPIKDADGRTTSGVVILHDITERKQAEAKLAEFAEEQRRSNNEELERFAYGVSQWPLG